MLSKLYRREIRSLFPYFPILWLSLPLLATLVGLNFHFSIDPNEVFSSLFFISSVGTIMVYVLAILAVMIFDVL